MILLNEIPIELTARFTSTEWVAGIFLFGGFVCIAIANLLQSNVYSSLLIANFKFQGVSNFVRESLPLDKMGAMLLFVNYWIAGSAITYLLVKNGLIVTSTHPNLLIFGVPFIYLLWHLFSLAGVGWLTGEYNSVRELIVVKLISTQLLGVIFFVSALVWILNARYGVAIVNVLIWVMIIESVLRWIKSILLIFRRGVAWYYIILYFCTLEILPMYVIYHIVRVNS